MKKINVVDSSMVWNLPKEDLYKKDHLSISQSNVKIEVVDNFIKYRLLNYGIEESE